MEGVLSCVAARRRSVWDVRGSLIVRFIFHVCILRDLSGDNKRSKQESSMSSLAQRTTVPQF
jgi:hypothetical protein